MTKRLRQEQGQGSDCPFHEGWLATYPLTSEFLRLRVYFANIHIHFCGFMWRKIPLTVVDCLITKELRKHEGASLLHFVGLCYIVLDSQ